MVDKQDVERLVGRLESMNLGSGPQSCANGTSSIIVQAGGVGVWITSTCCAIMLVLSAVMGFVVLNQSREIDDMKDYLTAIYMIAPQLKPTEKAP